MMCALVWRWAVRGVAPRREPLCAGAKTGDVPKIGLSVTVHFRQARACGIRIEQSLLALEPVGTLSPTCRSMNMC